MKTPKLILLAALFCVDVHVRADGEPTADCWGKKIPCAVRADGQRRDLASEQLTLIMASGALIEQRHEKEIQLVHGDFYADTLVPIKFNTPFAAFECNGNCKALITRDSDSATVKALIGDWKIKRLGDSQIYALRAGTQVTVSEVGFDGKAHMEFPQSLPWESTVMDWARLYPAGRKADFRPDVAKFRQLWQQGVESAAGLQQRAAARALASHEEGLAAERARRKAVENEEAALRRLFREKNSIDN